jgi:hypothetical protein
MIGFLNLELQRQLQNWPRKKAKSAKMIKTYLFFAFLASLCGYSGSFEIGPAF